MKAFARIIRYPWAANVRSRDDSLIDTFGSGYPIFQFDIYFCGNAP